MSDGPYKSLKMRKCWRRVARYAENESHSSSEVTCAVETALVTEFQAQVTGTILSNIEQYFSDSQSLFPPNCDLQIVELRQQSSNAQLANLLIDCSRRIAKAGGTMEEAIAEALQSWGARHVGSMVEHYFREGGHNRAKFLQTRAEEACISVANQSLASRLIDGSAAKGEGAFRRKTGLEDGPTL